MGVVVLCVFVLTYVGLALGGWPGSALDRTGCALLGAVLLLVTGATTIEAAKASVDVGTLSVLFGMMVLSAQYRLSGLYTAITDRIAVTAEPRRLLVAVIIVGGGLSAVLTNDVVCFAMTPLLVMALLRAGRDPLPYILGLACASNIGSALTPIGNPQNILIAQRMELNFPFFVSVCAVPVVVSLVFLYLFLRRRLRPLVSPVVVSELLDARKPLDRPQAMKAAVLTVLAIAGFCTPVPAVVTSLAVAAAVLLNRQFHTREMLSLVDWDLLVLFISLFVVMGAFEEAGFAQEAHEGLLGIGLDPGRGVVLVPLVAVLSNLVSNVPAVMLMLPFVEASREAGTVLALASSLAGNAFLVSSIANLIVVERARRLGVHVGFRDHLRVGLPVTLLSMLVALATGWILVSG